jgi:chorismate-pyruvate lyase
VIARRVVQSGARSRIPYVLAEALVVADRLPGMIADRLLLADASLDRLPAAARVEPRRELIDVAAVRADDAGDHLDTARRASLVRRTSLTVIRDRTVAAVTEWLVPVASPPRGWRGAGPSPARYFDLKTSAWPARSGVAYNLSRGVS